LFELIHGCHDKKSDGMKKIFTKYSLQQLSSAIIILNSLRYRNVDQNDKAEQLCEKARLSCGWDL